MAGKVDFSWGPGHSPAAGAFNAAGTVAAATIVAHDLGVTNPLWGLAVGGVAAITAGGVALLGSDHQHMARPVACYRAVCWLGAGIWSTVQLWSDAPWTITSVAQGLAWLAGGAAIAAASGAAIARAEIRATYKAADRRDPIEAAPTPPPVVYASREDAIAAEWVARLRKVCNLPLLDISNVELWPNGRGFTLEVELPADGATIDNVKGQERSLATAANLPPGCKVEVLSTTGGRRSIHVKVTTKSVLDTPIPYPRDLQRRSVNAPILLGVSDDMTPRSVSIRERNMVIVGQVESGKSNVVNCVIAGAAQCTDTLVFAIDQSGNGRFPRPWVRAHFEGRARRPGIGWVAIDDLGAELMTLSLINMINGRTADYASLMLEQNSDKILPSPKLPQLLLVIDEFKTLSDAVKENVVTIAETGRGAAVRTVVSALEATGGSLPRPLLTQSRVRVAMRASDESQIQYLLDSTWKSGRFDTATMTHPGMGLVTGNGEAAAQFKAAWLDINRIDDIAVQTGDWRPDLDAATLARGDTVTRRVRIDGEWVEETYHNVYTNRWNQVLPAMFPTAGGPAPERPQVVVSGSVRASAQTALADLNDQTAELERLAERAADPSPGTEDRSGGAVDTEWDAIVAGLNELAAPRELMRSIIQAHGPIMPDPIVKHLQAQGYRTTRQTVHKWLTADLALGLVRRADNGWEWAHGEDG